MMQDVRNARAGSLHEGCLHFTRALHHVLELEGTAAGQACVFTNAITQTFMGFWFTESGVR